ncbi:MAG: 4-alpha-glucanotransferase [Verrucomicrobiota bacterium JB022]|nr:4-alpha-glucanotransferase [Verrucomicrobiota bacterium JB022]
MKHPLFSWLTQRAAGALLHPTALPSEQGVGVLGGAAYEFIDLLRAARMTYWQVLPLGPTGYGDSPYQSFSAFAGNPYLIDLQALVENGLLKTEELQPLRELPRGRVDYAGLYERKWSILSLAYERFKGQHSDTVADYGSFDAFCDAQGDWLQPFAEFMAVKAHFGGRFWGEWPEHIRQRPQNGDHDLLRELKDSIRAHQFYQYLFFGQWKNLKRYANDHGVQIVGDAPIFVALDSADVWSNPDQFELRTDGRPACVAGVPPDYFSPTGQLWGNPLYAWDRMRADGYSWWLSRLERNLQTFDVLRLDHFRGFYDYWAIPSEAKDARSGEWRKGPALDLFRTLHRHFPQAQIIAEDLGDLSQAVFDFRDQTGLPGMAILHFAFGGEGDNLYLPHNLQPNSVIYPGVHDNDTTKGWYHSAPEQAKDHVRRYLRVSGEDIAWDLVRTSYASVSRLAIIQVQDLLSLGTEARFNTPGTAMGNWQWRLQDDQMGQLHGHAPYLKEIAELYYR